MYASRMPEFGPTLKAFRENHAKLSQSKLGERAGYDHSYVSRLESGMRTPTIDAVYRLSAAMKLNVEQRDRLLAAGKFLPENPSSLIEEQPIVGDLLYFLQHEGANPYAKELVCAAVEAALDMALMVSPMTLPSDRPTVIKLNGEDQ